MDDRKIRILQAIIDDYINTAEPVGSRTIAKKYDLGISSATIRNEMADLEDMGYIEQLHSSSGRKPSDKGYRLYVDKLMSKTELSPDEELIIKNQIINTALFEVDKIIKQAVELLSELTKLTCIVKTPSAKRSCIKAVKLMSIDSKNILAVFITDTGLIKNVVIPSNRAISSDIITRINNSLNSKLKNLSIEEINLQVISSLKKDLANHDDIFNAIIPALYDILNEADNSEVFMEGTSKILSYPEFKDIDKVRGFLSMMEDEDKLKNLLNGESKISVSIGGENFIKEAKECSIVSAPYSINGKSIGSFGIIGPTRIPYSKIILILTKVVNEVNNQITKKSIDD